MFPYQQHQVFTVITTAIIISFGVFSCHNLSLALIYSTGLFPSHVGGKEPSIRRQRALSPRGSLPLAGAEQRCLVATASSWQEQGCPHGSAWPGPNQNPAPLSTTSEPVPPNLVLLLAPAHTGLNQPCTQVGWEAEEGVHSPRMDRDAEATASLSFSSLQIRLLLGAGFLSICFNQHLL